jgi:hypothetical protein
VAENSTGPASEQSGGLERERHGRRVADQIDAAMHSMEAPRLQAVPDSAATEARVAELRERHDSTLSRGQRGNHPVGMCFVAIYTLSVHITTRAGLTSARQRL